jgi:uncharacterized protein YqeY
MPNIQIERVKGEKESVTMARNFIDPAVMAGITVESFVGKTSNGLELNSLIEVLKAQVGEVEKGDMGGLESMLTAQTFTLNAIFNSLALKASQSSYMDNLEAYLKLALKAQSQAKSTVEAISALQNPTIHVKQTNIAHGHQQINNCLKNELLENEHGQRLDGRTTTAAISTNPAMATLEPVNRPTN